MTETAREVCVSYRGIEKRFGHIQALRGIGLDIYRGEIFGFIGPDGAGKSTLIRIAMGIVEPDKGACRLLGDTDRRRARMHVGYVSQIFSLYQDMTVKENIEFFGSLYGAEKKDVMERAEGVLRRTGLWPFQDRLAGKLSGGMKQKLALAAGLLHTPQILFLDEPTTGVDPVARREFWAMLYEFNKNGLTIVVSTPYMDEAELCTRKMFINDGRILDVGTSAELLGRYGSRLVAIDDGDRRAKSWLMENPHVKDANLFGDSYHVVVDDADAAMRDFGEHFRAAGRQVPHMEEITPGLEDLFVAFSGDE